MVRMYLRDIGRIPMLTEAEFTRLAERIKRLRAKGSKRPLERAYHDLVEANLRLVVSIAKRYTRCGIPMMDLVQVGNMGLMKAVEKFDFDRGCRLSTYASKWIRASITRYISNNARTIRIPVNVIPMMQRIEQATARFVQDTGAPPSIPELADYTGMRRDQVRHLLGVPQQSLSFDHPLQGGESDLTLAEVVEDPSADSQRDLLEEEIMQRHLVDALLDALDPREREVVRLRYGLDGGEGRTQAEVGAMLDVSRQRVSQIEKRARQRLQDYDAAGHVLHAYLG